MKKLITLMLATVMVLSVMFASVPVSAEEELHNYITPDMMVWTNEYMGKDVTFETGTDEEGDEYMYSAGGGMKSKYGLPHLQDVRAAFVAALGDKDYAEVTIAFKVRIEFQDEYKGKDLTSRALLHFRCKDTSGKAADIWNIDYEDSLGGCEALFKKDGVHVIWYPDGYNMFALKENEWTTYFVDLYLEKEQILSEMTTGAWQLGFDRLNGLQQDEASHFERYKSFQIKDLGIYDTEAYHAANATPTPEPTATPAPTPTPTAKPEPTKAPDTTAAPDGDKTTAAPDGDKATVAPNNDNKGADNTGLIIGIAAAAVVVVAAIVVVVIVVNKKKAAATAEAEPEAEEKTEE